MPDALLARSLLWRLLGLVARVGDPAVRAAAPVVQALAGLSLALAMALALARLQARRRRRYRRLRVAPYRADRAGPDAIVSMYEALHKRVLEPWWRRLLFGQPSVALEVHLHAGVASLALTCPCGSEAMVEAALRGAYPNLALVPCGLELAPAPLVLRCRKRSHFIRPLKSTLSLEDEPPPVNRLITAMAAATEEALVQLALTPAPLLFERWARHAYRRREVRLARERERHLRPLRGRSELETDELRRALDLQHRPLFFFDLRVVAPEPAAARRIASELRAEGLHNHLVERRAAGRRRLLSCYERRIARGEGDPLPSLRRDVLASTELAVAWQLPSVDFMAVPFARRAVPRAPASPAILRPPDGCGALRDALGAVSIHAEMRRQNTAVPGAVEQGKTSYLVGTVAEDLRRKRCAVILLDPKGDAADAAMSLVPEDRACTLLDLAHPTCGFNPLAVAAPADVIADYVVGALRNLFSDADIRASSDRYLRNAIIAVLAADRQASLWDAARLLSVGHEGYAFRARVATRVRGLPELKEISEFFTSELTAQLADARSMTTSKLDAPVNKLARLLNSTSIKRVLLNDALTVDLDRVIRGGEVLVVRGALGDMGAGNTSVLMQLLVGMLDAALARQQDRCAADQRVAVALKVDEAPLVINRGFADTLALKRSAGLETVACWQTDAQWVDRDVRDQLDALFAHRVYFATASVREARAGAGLMMAEFSDTVRTGDAGLSALGRPDVRLHLPKHHAVASWTTAQGRQPPFVARTLPLRVDPERLRRHAALQAARGGRFLSDLRQPHWDVDRAPAVAAPDVAAATSDAVPAVAAPDVAAATSDAVPAVAASAPPQTEGDGLAGYRELVDLDRAHRVRRLTASVSPAGGFEPTELDLALLLLLARLGHALSTQLHRRLHPGRSLTTAQRQVKRLAEAGWLERCQFHRRDGGGVPVVCSISRTGLALLEQRGLLPQPPDPRTPWSAGDDDGEDPARDVRRIRRDVHVAGWVLAAERALGGAVAELRGRCESALVPPMVATRDGRMPLGPGDLRLPGGRTAHEFLRTEADGRRTPPQRFDTVRPDATLTLRAAPGGKRGPAVDLLVELDDLRPERRGAAKLERYDHLLSGWARHSVRYGRQLGTTPSVVFVCRDWGRAREAASRADRVLTAALAYAGDYPSDWPHPGREGILFAAERDVYEGSLRALGIPALPPDVRVAAASGDPAAAAAEPELRELPALGPRDSSGDNPASAILAHGES